MQALFHTIGITDVWQLIAATVVFLLGYLFYLNWRLTLIVAVLLPGIGWLVGKINRRLRRLNREHQLLTNELSYIVEETVGGYKVVKVHDCFCRAASCVVR